MVAVAKKIFPTSRGGLTGSRREGGGRSGKAEKRGAKSPCGNFIPNREFIFNAPLPLTLDNGRGSKKDFSHLSGRPYRLQKRGGGKVWKSGKTGGKIPVREFYSKSRVYFQRSPPPNA